MNDNRTTSILQRLSVILAVTAASYGLPHAQAMRAGSAPGGKLPGAKAPAESVASARPHGERTVQNFV